jgi:hypothetical protein
MTKKARVTGNRKVIVWTVALICLLESLIKGWGTFIYAPIALIAVPSYVALQFAAARRETAPLGRIIRAVACFLTMVMLALFVAAVAFGDTNDVTLFGFYDSTMDSPLTNVSQIATAFGYYAILPTFLLLIGLLISSRYQTKKQEILSEAE